MESLSIEVNVADTRRIISSVLHQIDVVNREQKHISISNDDTDLEIYLSDLLYEVNDKPQKRSYEFDRDTTEFGTALKSFALEQNLNENIMSEHLARRLLAKEVDTDNRYGHLGSTGKGHVKKGSFLQFLYRDDVGVSYLGVKIEHQIFIDESDFKKKIGLAVANKMYKACKVSFDKAGNPCDVFVYDTNTKPSAYWWKDFLELKEARGDALNTKRASEEVIKVVNTLRRNHLHDYTILRNSAIAAFKQKGQMKYDEFITNVFENYDPVDPALKRKLPGVIDKLKSLPDKKDFDTRFTLVPSEVSFKRSKVDLSREISLSIDEGIENMEDKIWAEQTVCGKKLVVIESKAPVKVGKELRVKVPA